MCPKRGNKRARAVGFGRSLKKRQKKQPDPVLPGSVLLGGGTKRAKRRKKRVKKKRGTQMKRNYRWEERKLRTNVHELLPRDEGEGRG